MSSADVWLFVLQPPIFPPPVLERFLPISGPFCVIPIVFRLSWVLLTLPLTLLTAVLPPSLTDLRHPSWSLGMSVCARVMGQLAWCGNYGLTANLFMPALDVIPPFAVRTYGKKLGVSVAGVTANPTHRGFQRGVLTEEAFMGGVGEERERLTGFWLATGDWTDEELKSNAGEGEKVLLYFVGGGYVMGHPLFSPFAWKLAKTTKCRVFCANYRKATDAKTAFPVQLHEAVAAWTYLLKRSFRPQNIYIVGNSAGGGLSCTLTLYNSLAGFWMPGGVILICPWLDMTASNRTIRTKRGTDLLGTELLITGRKQYMLNFPHPLKARPSSSETEYLLSKKSFDEVGLAHPILSPALIGANSPLLAALASKTKFLIAYGGAERLSGEIESFIVALRKSNVHVEVDEEVGAWHDTSVVPLGLWEENAERVQRKIAKFMGVGHPE